MNKKNKIKKNILRILLASLFFCGLFYQAGPAFAIIGRDLKCAMPTASNPNPEPCEAGFTCRRISGYADTLCLRLSATGSTAGGTTGSQSLSIKKEDGLNCASASECSGGYCEPSSTGQLVCGHSVSPHRNTNSSTEPAAATLNNYQLLEAMPGFYSQGQTMADFPALILAIYKLGIWTVGIAGLFMLVIGGFMYMASAGNNATITTAKKIITDALLGVVTALVAYLLLYVINPDLTKINIAFTKVEITEAEDTSPESSGSLGGVEAGVPGTCAGLSTQKGIAAQCSSASQQLSRMLECVKGRVPNAVITSITDSGGYARCAGPAWTDAACAHGHYSCHYGGHSCFSSGKSYAVDLSTRNGMSASTLISASLACGATYAKDESRSANHVHASVGKAGACGCN